MTDFILGVFMVLTGTAMYWAGEIYKKEFKYAMGIPIAVLGCIALWSWFPLWAIPTYFIACEIGYGDNNPLTKLVGKMWAIIIHGTAVGLASFPIISWWCLLAGAISGFSFWVIYKKDEAGQLQEPWVAILRGLAGTICLLGVGGNLW